MKGINIMLIEDNEGDIFLTIEAFEDSKIFNNIIVKTDGEQAIDYFENVQIDDEIPDIVLLDINLPKVNGHEVLKYLKGHEVYKSIPVIMLTTSASDKDIFRAYNNYVNCYITKPIEINDFLQAVSRIEDFWINIVTIPKTTRKA